MNNIFIDYLTKFLDLYYVDYPKRHIREIGGLFSNIKDILAADVKAKKYKGYKDEWLDDDKKLFEIFQTDAAMEAVFYYRVERAIFLQFGDHKILPYLANLMRMKTGVELYYSTDIGPGMNIQHGSGIVIGPRNRIGRNFIIHQNATIAQRRLAGFDDNVIIGDNVTVFAGAKILGSVRIGDNTQIGANAVLFEDAEPNSVYVGIPARKVK